MDKTIYVVVSHTRFNDKGEPVHGTASELAPLLEENNKNYIYIQHSLFSGVATNIITHVNKKTTSRKYGFSKLPFFLRVVQEFILTIYFVSKINKERIVYIGIDPLNTFTGCILKLSGKVKKVIFYTADYAENRYQNFIMNAIYHWYDRYSIDHADQVWNVSSRITSLRKAQGVPDNKNFFIPNAPILQNIYRNSVTSEKHTLVIVTHITKAIDFESIFLAIKKLQKKYKDIKLLIVGDGQYKIALGKKISSMALTKRVIFTGSKSHEEVMKILSQSGVGLAIYTDDFPWTKYGDSMKAREYLACGLPVIITNVPSTADDIHKARAGIVINNVSEIETAIADLFVNAKAYEQVKKNAFSLAKKYDFAQTVANAYLWK